MSCAHGCALVWRVRPSPPACTPGEQAGAHALTRTAGKGGRASANRRCGAQALLADSDFARRNNGGVVIPTPLLHLTTRCAPAPPCGGSRQAQGAGLARLDAARPPGDGAAS